MQKGDQIQIAPAQAMRWDHGMPLPEHTGWLGLHGAGRAAPAVDGEAGLAQPFGGVSSLPPKCRSSRLVLGFSHDTWSQAVRPVFGEEGCSCHCSHAGTSPYTWSALTAHGGCSQPAEEEEEGAAGGCEARRYF